MSVAIRTAHPKQMPTAQVHESTRGMRGPRHRRALQQQTPWPPWTTRSRRTSTSCWKRRSRWMRRTREMSRP
eukprot:7262208-Pyramimonas_sp.AAC.1